MTLPTSATSLPVLRRLAAFGLFVLQRFVRDRCLNVAASLSFTTLLSLVPLVALSLAVLSMFSAFAGIRGAVERVLTRTLLPQAGDVAIEQFRVFVNNASGMTGVGLVGLAVTAIMMLATVNQAFDVIFRVARRRPLAMRLLAYWALVTLGPLLIGGALSAMGLFLSTGERVGGAYFTTPARWMAPLVPLCLQTLAFTLVYRMAPNRRVRWRDAALGGGVAAIIFEAFNHLFALYLIYFPSYQVIYGALAGIPIFLVWIYLCWATVLFGAEIAAGLGEWQKSPRPRQGAPES